VREVLEVNSTIVRDGFTNFLLVEAPLGDPGFQQKFVCPLVPLLAVFVEETSSLALQVISRLSEWPVLSCADVEAIIGLEKWTNADYYHILLILGRIDRSAVWQALDAVPKTASDDLLGAVKNARAEFLLLELERLGIDAITERIPDWPHEIVALYEDENMGPCVAKHLAGAIRGWRADFPAERLAELQAGNVPITKLEEELVELFPHKQGEDTVHWKTEL
jgi:hypothetical protein